MGLKNNPIVQKQVSELLEGSKKLRATYPPISFLIMGAPKSLKIQNIYSLEEKFKNLYLFQLKNYENFPSSRYFLAISLASQSSDLLVSLAKKFITESKELKLIQYSMYPSTLRINLLLLIELDEDQSYSNTVELLMHIRQEFRKKLDKINTLMENE